MSMWKPFTEDARRAMVLAQEEAEAEFTRYIRPVHILLGALRAATGKLAGLLSDSALNPDDLRGKIERKQGERPDGDGTFLFSGDAKRAIEAAFARAAELGQVGITPALLVLGVLNKPDEEVAQLLKAEGVSLEGLFRELLSAVPSSPPPAPPPQPDAGDDLLAKIVQLQELLLKYRRKRFGEELKGELGRLIDTIVYTCQEQGWDIESLFHVDPELEDDDAL